MTLFFRALADVDPDAPALDAAVGDAFYDDAKRAAHGSRRSTAWLRRYARARCATTPRPARARARA